MNNESNYYGAPQEAQSAVSSEHRTVAPDLEEARRNHLKTEINNLVWMFASPKISLNQADNLACKIYEQITDTDDYDREN